LDFPLSCWPALSPRVSTSCHRQGIPGDRGGDGAKLGDIFQAGYSSILEQRLAGQLHGSEAECRVGDFSGAGFTVTDFLSGYPMPGNVIPRAASIL